MLILWLLCDAFQFLFVLEIKSIDKSVFRNSVFEWQNFLAKLKSKFKYYKEEYTIISYFYYM